jgi:hypothetical protein
VHWHQFERACPELAELAQARFAEDELVLVGSLRGDGSPRISPVEPDFVVGELLLGMMWQSFKALDLLRDSRLVVHSVPSDRLNPRGDVKLYGTATEVHDPGLRREYEEAIFARIDWRPSEPYHCFAVDVQQAAFVRFEEEIWEVWRWRQETGLRKETKRNE